MNIETVGELIDYLGAFDRDTRILKFSGYERGYEDISATVGLPYLNVVKLPESIWVFIPPYADAETGVPGSFQAVIL